VDILSAKFVFLALVALVVLGPERLSGALRSGGRMMGEYRRLSSRLGEQAQGVMDQAGLRQPLQELRALRDPLLQPIEELRSSLMRTPPGREVLLPPDHSGAQSPGAAVAVAEDQPRLELGWH
jgi:Sec-independent protein translocase protein TatA